MFSEKLKDVTEKTNIRQFGKIMLSSIMCSAVLNNSNFVLIASN